MFYVIKLEKYNNTWHKAEQDSISDETSQRKIADGEMFAFTDINVRDAKYIEIIANQVITNKADKGQEAENAIELNDAIKYYITKLMRDNDFDIKSDLLEIALDNTDISKQTKFQNDMKTRKAYVRMLNNVEEFERSIAIATNSDPTHPVSWVGENDFVNILSHIAIEDKPRYAEIAKLLNVEETYEPEAIKNEYIKLQQIVNNHISHPTPVIDGNTLASELPVNAGGTQGATK